MPKERTHWFLALRMRDALPDTGPIQSGGSDAETLKDLLEREEAAYLLGAVAPDSAFYGEDREQLDGELLNRYHGRDNDRNLLFLKEAARLQLYATEQQRSFLYGVTAHIVSDACFHPLVYYFCGWEEHPDNRVESKSLARHMRLETLLDIFYCSHYAETAAAEKAKTVTITDLLLGVETDTLAATGNALFMPNLPEPDRKMGEHFKKHASLYSRFSRPDYRLLSWLMFLFGITLHGKRDIIYRNPVFPLHDKELIYRHPSTGEKQQTTWETIAERTVETGSGVLIKAYQGIDSDSIADLPEGLSSIIDIPSSRELRYCNPVSPRSLFA